MSVEKKLIGREYVFSIYLPKTDDEGNDFHFVKEQVHYQVGDKVETIPEIKIIKNYIRPVYFTNTNLRTHKDKREFEHLDNLTRLDVRQCEVQKTVAKMIGEPWSNKRLRELCKSPYVYGADIPSNLFLRKELYTNKYPKLNSARTVAMFDTETDVIDGIGDIIITSAAFKNKLVVGVQKRKLVGYDSPKSLFYANAKKHLAQHIEKHNLEIEFFIAETEIELLFKTFEFIHKWKPDFLAIWNMNFDIPKVITACENAGVNPSDLLCDPRLKKEHRHCHYQQGQTKRITISGKEAPIRTANQWHTLELTASFYVIDAMCVYRRIRGGAELPSYSLDSILTKELGLKKLNIPEAEKFKKIKWHQFMQEKKIFDYMSYGAFDSFSMILLDLKTKDLSGTFFNLCNITLFKEYASQTKRLRDNFYFFGLERLNIVLGSLGPKKLKQIKKQAVSEINEDIFSGDDSEKEETPDWKTLDRKNWIVTLRAFMCVLGLPLIEEDSSVKTLIRTHVYDSDVVSSYPSCTLVCGVSKKTTRKEIIKIGDIPENVFRMQNLNFIFGVTNSLEYSQTMFGFPKFEEADNLFKQYKLGLK